MAMANKTGNTKTASASHGIRLLSPVPETTMDHSGLTSGTQTKTPSPTGVNPHTLSPELLAAIAANPASVAAALSPPISSTATTATAPTTSTTSTASTAALQIPQAPPMPPY